MESFLYHGIKYNDMDTLYRIVDSGFILPRCMIPGSESMNKNNLFNGTRYISLCQKDRLEGAESLGFRVSYNDFILGSLCIVLDKIENIICPHYVDYDMMSHEECEAILFKDTMPRYSYYIDEVQTDTPIPLSNFIAVGYPCYSLEYPSCSPEDKRLIENIKERLLKRGIDVPIIASNHYSFADDRECIKKYTLVK